MSKEEYTLQEKIEISKQYTPWTLPRKYWHFFGLEDLDLNDPEVQKAIEKAAKTEVDPELLKRACLNQKT